MLTNYLVNFTNLFFAVFHISVSPLATPVASPLRLSMSALESAVSEISPPRYTKSLVSLRLMPFIFVTNGWSSGGMHCTCLCCTDRQPKPFAFCINTVQQGLQVSCAFGSKCINGHRRPQSGIGFIS